MKLFIQNRHNQKVSILLENIDKNNDLVFIMHGLGGFKEQAHIQSFANPFLQRNFSVVRFDTTNSFGESGGNYEDVTVTNYYEDLEDVISWASKQEWYKEPFYLLGHSLGGISTTLFAEKFPEKVKALAPISTVISGKVSLDGYDAKFAKDWKESGWRVSKSKSKPGLIKRLKWSHMEDRLKYDILPNADKLMMPVLLIVGDKDTSTPPKSQQMLFDVLPGKKELHIIKDSPHTFREKDHLIEVEHLISSWLDNL